MVTSGKASSFADPKDVEVFRKLKSDGATDEQAFKYGDSGIGCWGDDCTQGSGQACALPPEDMEERWGSVSAAKHKPVKVTCNGRDIICTLKDRMPHRKNIHNGAVIDLSPDSVSALGLHPPIMIHCAWSWVD